VLAGVYPEISMIVALFVMNVVLLHL